MEVYEPYPAHMLRYLCKKEIWWWSLVQYGLEICA